MSRDNITSMTLVAYVHGELDDEDGLTSLMGPTGLSAYDLQAALADVQAEEALLAQALGGPRGETLLDDSRRRMLMETAARHTHKRPLKGKQRHDKRHLHTASYLLTFISGRYQGSEFPVEVGGELVIGRGGDLDLVLVEEMVSREHARIVHPSTGPITIEDLGSTNGTFVNGIKIVEPTPLREQDRILIGTNILKLTSAKPLAYGELGMLPRVDPIAARPAATMTIPAEYSTVAHPSSPTKLQGFIDEIPLPDLLQFFSTSQKSGVLIVRPRSPHGTEGRIYLRNGRVYHATLAPRIDTPPQKAFYRMLAWEDGAFLFEDPSDEEERFGDAFETSTEALMMEGMRMLDEIRHLKPNLPRMTDHLYIEQPLVPPLRMLAPELLDTLQLVHNYTEVETILNHSLASDLETLQDIVYLMHNAYVRGERGPKSGPR